MHVLVSGVELETAAGFVSGPSTQGGQDGQVESFGQKMNGTVAKQGVGTPLMIAANVVFVSGCLVDAEGLIEQVASVDPLTVGEAAVFAHLQGI